MVERLGCFTSTIEGKLQLNPLFCFLSVKIFAGYDAKRKDISDNGSI
jgi:hypothetical protein